MDNIVVERSAFVGLVTSAVEAYNRETNGFLVGNRGTRLMKQRPREVTVLRAAYPLQTEDRKPNWVSHGNERRSSGRGERSRTSTWAAMQCSGAFTLTRATTARRAFRGRTSITSLTSCAEFPEVGPPSASSGSRSSWR